MLQMALELLLFTAKYCEMKEKRFALLLLLCDYGSEEQQHAAHVGSMAVCCLQRKLGSERRGAVSGTVTRTRAYCVNKGEGRGGREVLRRDERVSLAHGAFVRRSIGVPIVSCCFLLFSLVVVVVLGVNHQRSCLHSLAAACWARSWRSRYGGQSAFQLKQCRCVARAFAGVIVDRKRRCLTLGPVSLCF